MASVFALLALSCVGSALAAATAPTCTPANGVVCVANPAPIGGGVVKGNWTKPFTGSELSIKYLASNVTAGTVEQVHLFPAYKSGSHVYVQWIVSSGFPDGHIRNTMPMTVFWGPKKTAHDFFVTVLPTSYTWGAGTNAAYTSGSIYTAMIGPLAPGTKYFYQIQGREVLSFYSAPSSKTYGFSISMMADVGTTVNSTTTYARAAESKSLAVLFVGDLTYADDYGSYPPWNCVGYNGTDLFPADYYTPGTCGVGGLIWDVWGRAIEKLASGKVMYYVPGNHELELAWPFGEFTPFKAYMARVPGLFDSNQGPLGGFDTYVKSVADLPNGGTPSKGPLFYSTDIGPVHVLGLSTYSPITKYTHQWYYVADDLCSVDRTNTPWLVVMGHTPIYNSDNSHYLEGEAVRAMYETWFYKSQVDLVIAGHVHAYERHYPVYQYQLNQCGPTYITLGDGGNIEGVAGPFLDPQPVYSAYREYSYGFADFTPISNIKAVFSWYRNQNSTLLVSDTVTLLNKVYAKQVNNGTKTGPYTCRSTVPTFCSLQA